MTAYDNLYGSGRPMSDARLRQQHILLMKFATGWTGHRILLDENPITYNHPGIVTQSGLTESHLSPSTGWDFTRALNFAAENNNDVFEIENERSHVMWQVFWSHPTINSRLRIYMEFMDQSGRTLENKIGGGNHDLTADRYWGWTMEGHESAMELETDIGMWIHIPRMTVRFAGFNPPGNLVLPDPLLRWKIIRLRHVALDPAKKDDARLMLKCLQGNERCYKWAPTKRPIDWSHMEELWGVQETSWNGKRGTYNGTDLAKLAGVA